ncbi:MAG: hydrogenase maturation protease [Anaerolineae bacterium]|nr:hydrogenase maturation protease [Anaerolineae bacterium]
MERLLIIGYGNPLRGDDGIGWHVAENLLHFAWAEDVPILTRHQLTPELAERLVNVDRVIFIDAQVGVRPGEIQVQRVNAAADSAFAFTHHLTPDALLAAARDLYGSSPDARLFTVTGESFALQETLSPTVKMAVPRLLSEIEQYATNKDGLYARI